MVLETRLRIVERGLLFLDLRLPRGSLKPPREFLNEVSYFWVFKTGKKIFLTKLSVQFSFVEHVKNSFFVEWKWFLEYMNNSLNQNNYFFEYISYSLNQNNYLVKYINYYFVEYINNLLNKNNYFVEYINK